MAAGDICSSEKMSLRVAEDDPRIGLHLPADIHWEMLDKSKFFFLGAAFFSGVSGLLYPAVVLKTRQQVLVNDTPCFKMAASILRHEGFKGFYRGFGTALTGTIPARALYMAALEITKSSLSCISVKMGFSEVKAAAISNAAAGLSAAMAAQMVWTPIDVVSQRLMVQGGKTTGNTMSVNTAVYNGGIDAFRRIIRRDGVRGLYKGFGVSIMTYAPSNAVWWASYSMANRSIWSGIRSHGSRKDAKAEPAAVLAVQGLSATVASGFSAVVTMPLDTIKTRMQVLDGEVGKGKVSFGQTVKGLVKEGGLNACYRGFGPRWASISISASTMITTYESIKRMSTKSPDFYGFLQ